MPQPQGIGAAAEITEREAVAGRGDALGRCAELQLFTRTGEALLATKD